MLSYEFKERLCTNQLGARTYEDLSRMHAATQLWLYGQLINRYGAGPVNRHQAQLAKATSRLREWAS